MIFDKEIENNHTRNENKSESASKEQQFIVVRPGDGLHQLKNRATVFIQSPRSGYKLKDEVTSFSHPNFPFLKTIYTRQREFRKFPY